MGRNRSRTGNPHSTPHCDVQVVLLSSSSGTFQKFPGSISATTGALRSGRLPDSVDTYTIGIPTPVWGPAVSILVALTSPHHSQGTEWAVKLPATTWSSQ